MRFRRSGTNWEGRHWVTSPSLNALMDEIEAQYPARHAGDGTCASKGHDQANPSSDHRPYPYTGPGVVNAVDAGEVTEDDGFELAEAIRVTRDPRVRYVIHESRLFSSYPSGDIPPFIWRPYNGPSPHSDHVHVSVLRANQGVATPWNLDFGVPMEKIPLTDWARPTFQWMIENGFYTEQTDLDKVRETYDFQQLVVMQKRLYDDLQRQISNAGVSEAQVKLLIRGTTLNPG